MKRILILLAACTKTPSTTTVRTDAATPLHVVMLDDYSSRETCDGIVRKIELLLDGKSAGIVEVPCRTKTVMPPPQVAGPTITVPAGKHTLAVREIGLGNSVEQELELPVIVSSADDGTDQLATVLPVWLGDDQLQIMQVSTKISFESKP